MAAKYETDLRIHSAEARRRFHTMGALVTVAVLVFGYDALSLLLAR